MTLRDMQVVRVPDDLHGQAEGGLGAGDQLVDVAVSRPLATEVPPATAAAI
jgi:hypothetical protein